MLLNLALEKIKEIIAEDGNEIMSLNIEVVEHLVKFINEQISYRLLNLNLKET